MTKMFYLATPYTRYPLGLEAAFRLASREAGLLMKAGLLVYSPIAHSHPIALHGGIDPLDWETWMVQCRGMLPRMDGLIALKADSWQESKGMREEIALMTDLGRPIHFMTPGVVPREIARGGIV